MGLMHWRSIRDDSPLSQILIGVFLVVFSCLLLWRYISDIISGEISLFMIVLFALLLLLFFPLMFFGGINEIREGFASIKESRNKNGHK